MVTKSVKAGQYEEDRFLQSEDYVKKKDDLLWSSSLSISKDDFDHFVSFSTFEDSNVITECNMCNEEIEQNHVCREYLQRMQPHLSVVPKGLGEITLTQTNPDCNSEKSYTSLDNNMYEEDSEGQNQTLFSFSDHRPPTTIDIIAKRGDEYEDSVDNIQVSLEPHNAKNDDEQAHNSDKSLVFPTPVWVNPIYTRDYVHYDSPLLPPQGRGYYFHPLMHKFPTEPPERHLYYEEPAPPKFVRSVKRLKRGPLKDTSYIPAPTYTTQGQQPLKKQCTRKREAEEKTTHSTEKYQNVTKYLSTNLEQDRHTSPPSEEQSVRKKRKYIRRTTKEEQIEKGTALWQFLMRKLEDPDCRGWIRWTGNDLEFKVLDQKEAAKQWGLCKNRAKMTFDKFSRSMRFYYSKGILVHNPDKRLTYIFCRQPHDPVYTEMLERVMKTLPPNTSHCTAVCVDPNHEHELIKLHVRRRPKRERKVKQHGTDESSKENNIGQLQEDEEDYDQSPPPIHYRSVGMQVDQPVYEEYHSSSMAALIAAAAQAVAVPIPHEESRVHDEHTEMTELPTSSRSLDTHAANTDTRTVILDTPTVTMDTEHTSDSHTYTMDSGVVREIPYKIISSMSEEEAVAMEANVVRELTEGVAVVTENSDHVDSIDDNEGIQAEDIPETGDAGEKSKEIKTENISIKQEKV